MKCRASVRELWSRFRSRDENPMPQKFGEGVSKAILTLVFPL
jgi:hypothetical protein